MTDQPSPMQIASQMRAKEGIAPTLGHDILVASGDEVVIRMTVPATLSNGVGLAHGGAVFALGDTAAAYLACACNAVHVTAFASISFLAPAHVGSFLTAQARLTARHPRGAEIAVSVTDDAGTLVAVLTASMRKVEGQIIHDS